MVFYEVLGNVTDNRGGFAQSLKFKYLYKSHCKPNELLWVLYSMVSLKSPQQFVGFAVTLVKIFKATPIDGRILININLALDSIWIGHG
jgi:hypothetical protein